MKQVKGGGGRKIGRSRERCAIYKQGHRREKNKVKKYRKMLKKLQDNCTTAINLKKLITELERKISEG